jgi:hypothetical protein
MENPMPRYAFLLLLPALAACDGHGDGNTSISIKADTGDGNVSLSTDKQGRTQIKAPGFEGSIKLPKLDIGAEDFDVNGVKLYPGSTIHDLSLDASDSAGGKDHAKVSVAFDAPASLDKVQAWFRDKMAAHRFKIAPDGSGFTGTTDEGDPIAVELRADGAEKSTGRLTVRGDGK